MQELDGSVDSQVLPEAPGSYRIGGVSRLSGVPVTTLRVWETRHGAFSPAKTTGQHRLYTESDVVRARLIRQLSGAGHSVGRIAKLPLPDLQRLAAGSRAVAPPARDERRLAVAVVGAAVATRLQSAHWQQRWSGPALDLAPVFPTLDDAVAGEAAPEPGCDLLIVRLNAVQADSFERVAQAAARLRAAHTIVLYNFASEPVLDAMRAAGMAVRREPVSDGELADLLRSVTVVDPSSSLATFAPGAAIPRRRYSDEVLARVAASPSSMLCECPRHLADLIGQLASFEEYSEQCLHASADDAHLHAYLRSIAGSARALFEHALQLVAQHNGLPLDDGAAPS